MIRYETKKVHLNSDKKKSIQTIKKTKDIKRDIQARMDLSNIPKELKDYVLNQEEF